VRQNDRTAHKLIGLFRIDPRCMAISTVWSNFVVLNFFRAATASLTGRGLSADGASFNIAVIRFASFGIAINFPQ